MAFDVTTWPRDPDATHRFLCAPAHPMPRDYPQDSQWSHAAREDVGECYEGCCDKYKCRDCGHTWRVECAQ